MIYYYFRQVDTIPRLRSLEHVSLVLQRSPNKQLRDVIEQGCSKEEIHVLPSEASSLSDCLQEPFYESLPINEEDEVNISEVKQPKVWQSIKLLMHLI